MVNYAGTVFLVLERKHSSVRTMLWKIRKTQWNTPNVCMKGQPLLTVALTVRMKTEKQSSPSAINVPQ